MSSPRRTELKKHEAYGQLLEDKPNSTPRMRLKKAASTKSMLLGDLRKHIKGALQHRRNAPID